MILVSKNTDVVHTAIIPIKMKAALINQSQKWFLQMKKTSLFK